MGVGVLCGVGMCVCAYACMCVCFYACMYVCMCALCMCVRSCTCGLLYVGVDMLPIHNSLHARVWCVGCTGLDYLCAAQ